MQIPLFPLHTVLCPGIALPLHVFEPRYRLLTERCVEQRRPFGIVLIREGREVGGEEVAIAGVGTLAEIREATRLPDGRYDLLVVGTGRFIIESVDAEREPYLVADVTPLDEEVRDPHRAVVLAARAMQRFVGYLHLLQPVDGETADEIDVRIEVETEPEEPPSGLGGPPERSPQYGRGRLGREPAEPDVPGEQTPEDAERAARLDEATRRLIIPDDPTTLSYLLSGIVQIDPLQRQILLESDTTDERLETLDAVLDRELWMLRRRLRLFTADASELTGRRN